MPGTVSACEWRACTCVLGQCFGPSTLEDVPPGEDTMMIPMIRIAILLSVFVHLNAATNTITMAKVGNLTFFPFAPVF